MKITKKKNKSFSFLALICGMLFLGACGYEKNEVDYENEKEAAENEIGDQFHKPANDSVSDGEQPARIDGQEGHPAPPTGEESNGDAN